MKEAILIVGPESSGTRMLTEAFVRLGYFGDFGHSQRLDDMRFVGNPDRIVLRRSMPHDAEWPNLAEIIRRMQDASYYVRPVLIWRDKDCCRLSQAANHNHAHETSSSNIPEAIERMFAEFAAVRLWPVCAYLGAFVKYREVRTEFFRRFGEHAPDMEFFDPDRKYLHVQPPLP